MPDESSIYGTNTNGESVLRTSENVEGNPKSIYGVNSDGKACMRVSSNVTSDDPTSIYGVNESGKACVRIEGSGGGGGGSAPVLYREFELDSDGVLQASRTTTHIMNFTGVRDVSGYMLGHAYQDNRAISGAVDMSDLTSISGASACEYMFKNCTGLTSADLSGVTKISGGSACMNMFQDCTGLTSFDLSALTTISGVNSCSGMFGGCQELTSADLSGLTTITGTYGCSNMFARCSLLATVYIGGTTAINFGTATSQFFNMFNSCSQNIDVYAPAANQAQIESFSGYPNFGATGTVTWHWRS